MSPKGLVTHREDWEGRVAVVAEPNAIHYVYTDAGEFRPMTMPEMIAKGYFFIGTGPRGF